MPEFAEIKKLERSYRQAIEAAEVVEKKEVELYQEKEIPWSEIAFPVVKTTIKQYFEDTRCGHFPVRMFNVRHHEDRTVSTELISCNKVQSSDHS